MSTFLSAEWRKLAMANYVVDEKLLEKFVPHKTEIDKWNGRVYVSLVGFMFVNTKMLGMKIPFHVNFEEVNLRFYVRYNDDGKWKRGVVFIKEIVPRMAITLVANTVYGENYETLKMKHEWKTEADHQRVEYSWRKNGEWNSFEVKANKNSIPIAAGSEEEFITEHYWGYAKRGGAKTTEYEVQHPRWEVYPVNEYQLKVDFGKVYGKEFSFLAEQKPHSVFLAEGSEIRVMKGRRL